MAAHSEERPITVYGAMAANFLVAVTKFVAAFFTGSSSMLSEGIHSLVDTGNQGLLLLGDHRSSKPADDAHPFGYGQELYFWSLVVAMILFGLGGGMSVYEGVTHILKPGALEDPTWAYVTLGLAVVFEGTSFIIAFRALWRVKGDEPFLRSIHSSKDPMNFVVLFEDSAALVGLAFAFLGIYFSHQFEEPRVDGLASVLIGLLLASVAIMLAYECKGLLIGESADSETVRGIRQIISADPDVQQARRPRTMHLGPKEILLNLDVTFRAGLTSDELVAVIDRLERAIRREYPEVGRIFVEAQSLTPSEDSTPA